MSEMYLVTLMLMVMSLVLMLQKDFVVKLLGTVVGVGAMMALWALMELMGPRGMIQITSTSTAP